MIFIPAEQLVDRLFKRSEWLLPPNQENKESLNLEKNCNSSCAVFLNSSLILKRYSSVIS